MPGATVEARWASTASPMEEVTQKRVAEGGHGPLDDVLGGGELELGAGVAHQVAQLVLGAALGRGAAGLEGAYGGGGGHGSTLSSDAGSGRLSAVDVVGRRIPRNDTLNARMHDRHSHAP